MATYKSIENQVVEILSQYSKELAQAFKDKPFSQISLARAFAGSFGEEVPEIGFVVIRAAYAIRDARAAHFKDQERF